MYAASTLPHATLLLLPIFLIAQKCVYMLHLIIFKLGQKVGIIAIPQVGTYVWSSNRCLSET